MRRLSCSPIFFRDLIQGDPHFDAIRIFQDRRIKAVPCLENFCDFVDIFVRCNKVIPALVDIVFIANQDGVVLAEIDLFDDVPFGGLLG